MISMTNMYVCSQPYKLNKKVIPHVTIFNNVFLCVIISDFLLWHAYMVPSFFEVGSFYLCNMWLKNYVNTR